MAVRLERVQAQVQRLGLGWRPGETVNTGISKLRAQARLGAVPPPGHRSLAEREAAAAATRVAAAAGLVAAASSLPSKVDWRNKGGNWVTPIRDQAFCGSCVAFGTVAVLESMVRIAGHAPKLSLDLSEAHLFFCYGPDHGAGACPDGGWWPDDSFACLKQGVVDEACFPYTDENQPCKLGPDWQNRLTTASKVNQLDSVSAMKQHLATVGPMSACFTIYEDFQSYYTGGVYRYHEKTSGEYVGGHCVCIVGYDDAQRCWIAKNSWGTSWGEKGFFRIGYGECGIDATMWGITGTVKSPAIATMQATGLVGGGVRHTIRQPDASWQAEWDEVPVPSAGGAFQVVGSAGVNTSLQVIGLSESAPAGTDASNLWHTVRNPAGSWQGSFGNVKDPGRQHTFSAAACAGVGTSLHVLAVDGGELFHTIRSSSGKWQASFGHLATSGAVTAVAAAGIGSDLHVVALIDGAAWHNSRNSKGKWSGFVSIAYPAGAGPLTSVSCAAGYGQLQVVATGQAGANSNLWHTVRKASGSWQASAGNVKDPGKNRSFDAVTCAFVGGNLQILGLLDGQLWHTVRYASGTWQAAFGHPKSPDGAEFSAISAASVR